MASKRRKKVQAELFEFTERAVRILLFRTYQILTSATPVDTGFARAGWSPSIGAPDPGPGAPASVDVAAQQAAALFAENQGKAAALARTYTLAQGPVFIVNNVRYVLYLNQGTSAQAPAMFVELGVAQAVAATRAELS